MNLTRREASITAAAGGLAFVVGSTMVAKLIWDRPDIIMPGETSERHFYRLDLVAGQWDKVAMRELRKGDVFDIHDDGSNHRQRCVASGDPDMMPGSGMVMSWLIGIVSS